MLVGSHSFGCEKSMTNPLRVLALVVIGVFASFGARSLAGTHDLLTPEEVRRHRENVSGPVPYKNMRQAMDVLKKSKDPIEIEKVRDNLRRIPVQSHDDLMALYDAAQKAEESVPVLAKRETIAAFGDTNDPLAFRLKDCTDPAFHDDIAALLEKEYKTAQHEAGLHLPRPALTTRKPRQGWSKAEPSDILD